MRMSSKKRLLAGAIALALMLTLLPAVTLGADVNVYIEQSDTEAEVWQKIQDAIIQTREGGAVIVMGSKTNVEGSLSLGLYEATTLIWKAVYNGFASEDGFIELYGAGVFEIAEGADIRSTNGATIWSNMYLDTVAIVISGGAVENSGEGGIAVSNVEGGIRMTGGTVSVTGDSGDGLISGGDITISGTALIRVSGESGTAIQCYGDNFSMSGGTVEMTGENCCAIYVNDVAKITGGTIRATGDFSTLIYFDTIMTGGVLEVTGKESNALVGSAIVMGGTVSATGEDSYAIFNYGGISAYLAGTCIGDFGIDSDGGTGMIVEVDSLSIPSGRHGTALGLNAVPESIGSVTWDCSEDIPNIDYAVDDDAEEWHYEKTLKWGEDISSPVITTEELGVGKVGDFYRDTLSATGNAVITWSIGSGALPDGLTLSPAGKIMGTPTESGIFTFTVVATNDIKSVSKELSIEIDPPPSRMRGDANEDGKITAADAASILRHIVKLEKLSAQGLVDACVTGGAVPTAADAAKILRYIVKLENEL